jgi:hypothetical protein
MAQFNTINEVCEAVKAGRKVHWSNENYVVGVDMLGSWFIAYRPWSKNPNYVGLFYVDGVTTDYNPEDFYIAEKE